MIINADKTKEHLKSVVGNIFKDEFHDKGKVTSILIINASDDPANERYINQKKKLLDSFGIRCHVKKFNEFWTTSEIRRYIENTQDEFTGVMIQSPVYKHLIYEDLLMTIDYTKDIDGLHPMNQGLLYSNSPKALLPCTALGVLDICGANDISLNEKRVVIIGRGKLVADPLAKMLEHNNCTVTKIHTKTSPEYSAELIKNADIIISCAGKDLRHMINPSQVGKCLEALIGVGFRYEDGKQLQDFKIDDSWRSEVKITNNTNATGTATVCALVNNLLQIKK